MLNKILEGLEGDIWHEYYQAAGLAPENIRPACHAKKKLKSGNTRAIIIIHGIIDSPFSQADIAEVFYQLGYDVYLPLLAGHGLHTIDSLSGISDSDWLSNITRAIELLDYETVSIAGFSLGGLIAFYLSQSLATINGKTFLFSTPFKLRQQRNGLLGLAQQAYINHFNKLPLEYFKKAPLIDDMNPYIYSRIDMHSLRHMLKLQKRCLKLINSHSIKGRVYAYHSEYDKRASSEAIKAVSLKHVAFKHFLFQATKKIGHGALIFRDTIYRLDGNSEQHIIEQANPYFDELAKQIALDDGLDVVGEQS